jgi:hypothetical protein
MKFLALLAVCIFFLPVAVNAESCPEPAEFESWRNGMADLLSENASSDQGMIPQAVQQKILGCFPSEAPACFNTVLAYSSAMKQGAPEFPDFLAWPEEFMEKSLFGESTGNYIIPSNLEALAQERGWDFIRFKTRSSGGFTSRPGLAIVHIPGKEVSRYLQFSTAQDDGDSDYHEPVPKGALSGHGSEKPAAIVVVKGGEGVRSKIYFQRWMRDSSFSRKVNSWLNKPEAFRLEVQNPTRLMREENPPSKTCISCHANGLRAISPVGYHPDRHGWKRHPDIEAIKRLNEAMASYGQVEFPVAGGESVRLDFAGPPIGSKTPYLVNPTARSVRERFPTRTIDFLEACAEGEPRTISFSNNGPSETYTMSAEPKIRYGALKRAMNCTKCHNGGVEKDDRGVIISQGATHHTRLGMFGEDLRFKILFDQSMPQKGKLNMNERVALVKCLEAEAKLELAAWLKRDDCSSTARARIGI